MKNFLTQRQINLFSNLFASDKFIYCLLGASVILVLTARIHLLTFPFERDEGEYAYMAKLILDGHAPYTLAYNMKLPGTYYMYALIMWVSGKSIVGVHIGLMIISTASMLLLFSISKNFVSKIGAVISAASFGIMGTSWTLYAQAAHATHFVAFFALLGIYFLLQMYKYEKNKLLFYFIPGVFFSLAFICKQSGIFFVLFGFAAIITKEFNLDSLFILAKKLLVFSLGFVIPIIVMLSYFYFFGNFDKFWFWTVKYLVTYGDQIPISYAPEMFKIGLNLITSNYSSVGYTAMWIVSLLGIPFIFINKESAQNKITAFLFVLFSFITILPGFYFREHYFITLLPAAGLLIAFFFDFSNNFFINRLRKPGLVFFSFSAFLILIGIGINANKDYLFYEDTKVSCKKAYGQNPFAESIEIAEFLKQNSTKDDKIAVLGSEPQICFYADRYSATGYIYTYNLVEIHAYALSMQQEMAKEIETNKPKFMLFVKIDVSWLCKPNYENFIFKWADEYVKKYYKLVGLYDVFPNRIGSLKVYDQLNNYRLHSEDVIYIYERIN